MRELARQIAGLSHEKKQILESFVLGLQEGERLLTDGKDETYGMYYMVAESLEEGKSAADMIVDFFFSLGIELSWKLEPSEMPNWGSKQVTFFNTDTSIPPVDFVYDVLEKKWNYSKTRDAFHDLMGSRVLVSALRTSIQNAKDVMLKTYDWDESGLDQAGNRVDTKALYGLTFYIR